MRTIQIVLDVEVPSGNVRVSGPDMVQFAPVYDRAAAELSRMVAREWLKAQGALVEPAARIVRPELFVPGGGLEVSP